MTEEIEPPKSPDHDLFGPDVDTFQKKYWFEVTDQAGYRWDLKGRYALDDSGVWITEITVRPAWLPPEQPPKQLDPELLRRLTRLPPLRDRIQKREVENRELTIQTLAGVKAAGRESRVLEAWAREDAATEQAVRPWKSRFSDDEWAEWASDFIDRVKTWQGTYRIVTRITEEKAWGEIGYQTVRDRIKTMRRFGWVQGKGAQVEEGPRLIEWQQRKDIDDG